ncbi:MAG: hypothetical protein HQ553_05860 [Chloroflexi bacterium]|nr:hypothetical protein [Chloroflexota bacterium]
MKAWGLLSITNEDRGLQIVLDENWNLILRHQDYDPARFDPSEYTLSELLDEVEGLLQIIPSSPRATPDLVDTEEVSIRVLGVSALIHCNWN